MAISPSLIRKSFNRAARSYDTSAQVQNQCAEYIADKLPPLNQCRILDLGCGTGNLVPYLLNMNPSFYLGIDLSEKMLMKARKKTRVNPYFHYICSDISSYLRANTSQFDCIVSNATMQWLEMNDDFLQNLCHALTPKGSLLFSYFLPTTFQQLKTVMEAVEEKEVSMICDNFLPGNSVKSRFDSFFVPVVHKELHYEIYYRNIRELLQSIRKTGISPLNSPAMNLSRKKLHLLEEEYKRRYDHLVLSYKVDFFYYKSRTISSNT